MTSLPLPFSSECAELNQHKGLFLLSQIVLTNARMVAPPLGRERLRRAVLRSAEDPYERIDRQRRTRDH